MSDDALIQEVYDLLTHSFDGEHVIVFKLDASPWTGNQDDIRRHPVESSRRTRELPENTFSHAKRRVAEHMVKCEAGTIREWLKAREKADG